MTAPARSADDGTLHGRDRVPGVRRRGWWNRHPSHLTDL